MKCRGDKARKASNPPQGQATSGGVSTDSDTDSDYSFGVSVPGNKQATIPVHVGGVATTALVV